MDIHVLRGKTIMLLGQPRALSTEEFHRLLKTAGIQLDATYHNEIAAVIEGRLVNPLEQEQLDRLYTEKGVVSIDINTFEHALCSQIEPERILMSLKLSRDQQRLRSFLQNPHIDDAFFLRLLRFYDWNNDGFFESDENRDVTAALIGRYYANIERNHNIQYSTLGLMHLIAHNDNDALIRTLGALPPIRQGINSPEGRQLQAVIDALAGHPATDEPTLEYFVRHGDRTLRTHVAKRPTLSAALQRTLFAMGDSEIIEALAGNPNIDPPLADTLGGDPQFAPMLYGNIVLDMPRFEKGLHLYPADLAKNPTLDAAMQQMLCAQADRLTLAHLAANPALLITEELMRSPDADVRNALAANPTLSAYQLEALHADEHCKSALASNPSSPPELLQALFAEGRQEVLSALADNPATPLELLQQLQLDARFERRVRGNAAFAHHIKRENIGWL